MSSSSSLLHLTPTTSDSSSLLHQVYHSLLVPTFSSSELDSYVDFRSEFTGTHPRVSLYCFVCVSSSSPRTILSASIYEYFYESDSLMYSYLLVRPSLSKGTGYGRRVADFAYKRMRSLRPTCPIFVEMHDPTITNRDDDVMDPFLRVRMFQRMGVFQVGDPAFPFRQPALSPNSSSVPFLLGLVGSRESLLRGPVLDAHVLRRFLVAYWRDCCYPRDPCDYPDYVEMMRRVPLHSKIPLVPFSCINRNRPRVLIVGAGISGLSCAESLVRSGLFELEIWESRDRCGGRVDTRMNNIDLGASWLHGLTSFGDFTGDVRSHHTNWNSIQCFRGDGSIVSGSLLKSARDRLRRLLHESSSSSSSSLSLQDLLCSRSSNDTAFSFILSSIESEDASCLSSLSSRIYANSPYVDYPLGDRYLKDGTYSTIVRPLQVSIPSHMFRYNRVVRRITTNDDDGVRVECTNGINSTFDYVVVTLPLGVLKRHHKTMFPNQILSDFKRRAIERIGFGTMEKIALTFPVVFWDSSVEIFGFNAEMHEGRVVVDNRHVRHNIWFVNCVRPCRSTTLAHGRNTRSRTQVPINEKKILVALVTGELEIQMRAYKTSNERINRILAALRVMYPDTFVRPEKVLMSSWNKDPYSLGSYSNNATKEDIEALSSPAGRICFAGEATSSTRYGTMDGAYDSGRREAKRLISLFRRGGVGRSSRSRL